MTDHGRQVFHDAERVARATSEALLAHFAPDERSTLTALLGRFVDPSRRDPPS